MEYIKIRSGYGGMVDTLDLESSDSVRESSSLSIRIKRTLYKRGKF